MAREIIFINPILKEYLWGGKRLQEFGYNLPSDTTAECWAVSSHPNGDCTVAGGSYDKIPLSELWKNHAELFGNIGNVENIDEKQFPLLIKLIDAEKDLSIQVHPNDEYARTHENGASGKTECWYVLDAVPEAKIIIGHHAKTNSDARKMIEQKKWKELVREIPVHKGDFFLIEPGTVHAIKGGTLIFEAQQNSNITYRLYDYDRLSNGKPRELHIEKSLDVMTCPFVEKSPPLDENKTKNKNLQQLVSCKFFSVWHAKFSGENTITQDLPFMVITVIDGEGTVDGLPIKKGANFILPCGYGDAHFSGDMEFLVSSV